MKKYISKTMFILSMIFFIAVIITVFPLGFGNEIDTFRLAIYFTSAGLFLGLYRIIDLLERK